MAAAWLVASIFALPCGQNRAFLDLGANDGQSLTWFARHWAPKSSSRFTSVTAFEMNSVFQPVLQALLKPWDGTLVAAAAWIVDGSMQANLQLPGSRTASKGGVLYNMTASSLEVGGVPLNRRRQQKPSASAHETKTTVPTVDLSRWLAERFCQTDNVDIKMDIEGWRVCCPKHGPRARSLHPSPCETRATAAVRRAEFEVLEHLLRTGHANLIDTLAVEWHTSKVRRTPSPPRRTPSLTSADASGVT
jgi:hypothetical protein